MRIRSATVLVAFLASSMPVVSQASAQGTAGHYHITQRYTLGGDGGWDYVILDTTSNRLFIGRANRVMVVDENSGKLLGEVPGLVGAHGTAIDVAGGHGFASSGRDSSVVMFDLQTLNVLGRATAAEDADAIIYDPVSRFVYSFNGDANSASVLDPATGSRVANIPLGGKPEYGVSAGDGRLYANIEDKSEIVEIDPQARRVSRRWSLAPCESPSGLAIDRANHLLFSVCGNKRMAVSSITTGRVVTTVPIGAGVDATAFDPATGNAFASNGDGTLTVVHEDAPDRFRVVETVPTMTGARTMALDPRTHRVYVVSAQFGPAPAQATANNPRRRPPIVPGTFTLLVLEP
jgi:YVTN family beta-propeller protein